MHDPVDAQEMIVHNQQALEELAWAIESSAGKFSLILARCNYGKLRDRLVQQLHQICTVPLQEITLHPSSQTLYTTIRDALGNEPAGGVLVFGLETVHDLDRLLSLTNQVREEFRTHFPFPLVLWVTDEIHQKLMRLASDFESWATTTEFTIPPAALLASLQQGVSHLFAYLLQEKPEFSFTDLLSQVKEVGFLHRRELNAALQELQSGQIGLEPELQADLAFLQGVWVEDDGEAVPHLAQSLTFWQSREEAGKTPNPPATTISHQLKRGLILYFLGRRGYNLLDQTSKQTTDWEPIKTHLHQAIARFEQANRPDLVAKCLNRLMRLLNRQQHWSEVETLARRSLDLQAVAPSRFRLVYAQGFLTEAMLRQDRAAEAYDLAQQVLETVKTLPPESQWLRPLYLLYLAWAERKLGKPQAAIAHLVEARALGDQGQPTIYRHILETLGELYFDQKEYLKAFEVKRERLSIEQQYGIRAFVGAGRLHPKREAINPEKLETGQMPGRPEGMVAPEIAAAGRQQDLNQLIERIGRNDYRLIVLHGNSGVGKSSLVNAGLVPALKQQAIGYQQNLPIVLRVYTHWVEELDQRLPAGVGEASPEPPEPTVATLLDRLRQLEQRHLRSILIFDQFEEFFFIYPRPEQRRPFFEFLAGCMQVLSVKVILSLREDYLHFLLECGRLGAIETAGIDILSQNVRYYLGNFSAADTRAIIQDLTKRARFYLEPDLVEQLVQDLASELGEVRPIELQVVGAQLQEDQITTLAQYRALGNQPKETLVERYLQTVVNSCGQENQQVADLVLYLLTDEKGTRPLKTRAELQKELQEFAFHRVGTDQSLDLVLRIFVDSGLVLLLPETPEDRYQLVHDYLAAFIRQQQESRLSRLMAELEQEREQRKQGEAKLNRFLKRALFASVLAGLGLAVLAVTAIWSAQRVEKQKRQIEANEMQILAKSADVLLTSGRTLDALLESFKLVERTEQLTPEATSPLNANSLLQQALFEVSEQNRLSRHNSVVAGVSFSPDGKTIASASWDGTVKLWSREGRELHTLKGHTAGVSSVHFSPDGRTLASASWDGTVKLWNRNGRNFLTLQGHPAAVSRVRFSPDGKTIASASWDKTIKLWSLAGKVLHTLQGHTDAVYSISFSPDGKTLASASADKTVKLWSLEGRELRTLKGHKAKVYDVRFSPDGKTLASASEDKTVKFWHLDGRPISTFEGYYGLYGVDFSPDGKTIATVGQEFTVRLFTLDGKELRVLKGHAAAILGISFSPDGKTIASASRDRTMRLWSLDDGRELRTLKGHRDWVNSVSFSPDGKTIASTSGDKTIKLWNLEGRELRTLQGHVAAVNGVSFSPDGKTIASASGDKTIKLWNLEGRELRTLQGHMAAVNGVSFSPDGKTIASASGDGSIKLWTLEGRKLRTLKGHKDSVTGVSFSPDGKTIASVSWDKTVKLWTLEGRELGTLQRHTDAVHSVSFSPDGKTIAFASGDKTVKLWTLEGRELRTLQGHTDEVYGVSFSPDGKTIASASEDNTVQLWSLEGEELNTLKGHTSAVYDVSFSPNGKTIASASFDGTVKLWRLDLDNLLPQACEWLNHYLASHPEVLEELKRCQSPQIIQFAAATLVQEGEDLAFQEKLAEAESRFRKAQAWNPRLTFDVQRKVEEFANRGRAERLISAGNEQVRQGKVKEALNAYNQAQTLDPDVKISVDNWDELCWYGSLYGFPKEVLFACDKAIALATTAIAPSDNIAYYRDSRGIARAMMGDAKGAMTDFQSYVNWTQGKADWSEGRKRRQGWIESLRRSPSRTPFTQEDLKALRDE
ncbi:WD40 repeat domain-containing protein [Leptothermofonsia sichuanensis E412]|uniref:WD40 repeat domain-containing protein n=1 Tax=Leptothermofonsia sichuanensis TaxID=2917832 RepID=UPI001CA6D524|nr:WD40 repeat domain-containing protein [Leptothermofonsia sichuanensis]QZZ22929.1 WD40 repeat domain-containing protein [Leptothermofonsia sichuanensis E412]